MVSVLECVALVAQIRASPVLARPHYFTYFLLWILATCNAKFLWVSSTNGTGMVATQMFHDDLGMLLDHQEQSFVARFPAAKTDNTTPPDVPASSRPQSLSAASRIIIVTESHGARDVLQKRAPLVCNVVVLHAWIGSVVLLTCQALEHVMAVSACRTE